MKDKKIKIDSTDYEFRVKENEWQLTLVKSQTKLKDNRQLALLKEPSDYFVPVQIEESSDAFLFSFAISPHDKTWDDIKKLNRNEKLRLLLNVSRFKKALDTRITFFLHPDNIVFDDNLVPKVVYRGIRNLLPPFELDVDTFFIQYKCLVVALFSKNYSFDELYSGSIQHVKDTEFESKVANCESLQELEAILEESYRKEQAEVEKSMVFVPKKRFRFFKRMAISTLIVSVLLAIPLVYFGFVKAPYQEKLLEAHRDFLAADYGKVIDDLHGIDARKLPDPAKYVLAYSYVKTEKLSEDQKTAIMNNISLKSDRNYLLYWIYNGRGDFEESMDLAKYIDDPQLIIYSLIKQIELAKNDPNLTGSEMEEHVRSLQEELNEYQEEYGLDMDEDGVQGLETTPANAEEDQAEQAEVKEEQKEKKKSDKEEAEK